MRINQVKKKLTVYFGVLIGFIALLFVFTHFTSLIKKQPISSDNYTKIMQEANYKVSETKETKNTSKSPVKQELYSQDKSYQIRFAVLDSDKSAKEAFNKISSELSNNKDKDTKLTAKKNQNGRNFKIFSAKVKNDYFMISQVDNTVLLLICSYNNKEIINNLADKLGYGYSYYEEITSVYLLFLFGLIALLCVPFAFILKKAGKNPLIAFIPFYNDYSLCQIADKNGWKMLLLLVPVINIIYRVILSLNLASVFKKSEGFGIGIFFLPIIFLPILAFDDSKYLTEENQ